MATAAVTATASKSSKWFSSKATKLSLPRVGSKSKSSSSSPCPSPSLVLGPKKSSKEDELRQVFGYFDSDGDGRISGEELRVYFQSIGESMSHEEAQKVIGDFDVDGDSLLEFQDFVRLMEQGSEVDDDLKRAFQMFEVEKGCGCITPKGLQQMFNRLGDSKTYEECVAMIRVFDLDGNGVLDFHEFHRMMT
uniref:Calmodulin-like protein 49b n=1 Tax=Vitis amurensis TaxID=103351 RepID=A0A6B9WEH0_9ROSI|nr:calmodulin-like protein 49b [Vitis amurensis]